MKVRLIKNWSFYKSGEVAEVFEPTARNWILNGIAEEAVDSRSIPVERTVDSHPEASEKAVRKQVARKP
jgi:hypothetical protein